MNKFEKFLTEKVDPLSYGSDRITYLYRGKVIKLPMGESAVLQSSFEQDIWETMPDKFRQFFPNPEFVGRLVVEDYVEIADGSYFGVELDDCFDETISNLDEIFGDGPQFENDLVRYCLFEELEVDWEIFAEFLYWFQDQGGLLVDIFNNMTNIGSRNNKLQIVDWGWSHVSQRKYNGEWMNSWWASDEGRSDEGDFF